MISENLINVNKELPSGVKLVAVSKYHPVSDILEAYSCGQRRFAESRPQEFSKKVGECPSDIEWHFIGHLQTNKLKMVLPYASLVQSVDSEHLLREIDKWGKANDKTVNVLLEMHIALEDSKQGFYEEEILDILFNHESYKNIRFCGLMGMASHTDEKATILADFQRIAAFKDYLSDLFPEIESFTELSIGMSDDWPLALQCSATIIRIGTAIFGERSLAEHPCEL